MADREFSLDIEMFVLYPLFALGVGATLGLISQDFLPVLSLDSTVIETAGIEWSQGRVLALAALVGVVANRDTDLNLDGFGGLELFVVYATVGLLVAPPFYPPLESTLAGDVAAFVSFTVTSIGFALVSWLN